MTKLIGLHGYKKCGKDTTANGIQRWCAEHRQSSVVRWYAAPMKLSIAALLDIPIADVDWLKDDGSIRATYQDVRGDEHVVELSGREFLQRYGTESHRQIFGWDFWVDQLVPEQDWEANFDKADYGIIADVRFDNEAAAIHKAGGEVWLIDRPGIESDGHASEQLLEPEQIDQTVKNDGSIAQLYSRVYGLLSASLSL